MARTTNGGLTRIDSSPGDLTLFNTMILDAASLIAGFTNSVNVAGTGSSDLLQADLRVKVVKLTGALTGARTLKWPITECARKVIFWNATTGAFSLTVITTAGGSTGVVIPQGYRQELFHDDTHVYPNGPAVSASSGLSAVAARVFHSAAQSIPNITHTALAFNSERYDPLGMHDNATANSRLTCVRAGVHHISGSLEYAANATGFRQCAFRVNGVDFIYAANPAATPGGHTTQLGGATMYYLAVGDYVELMAHQDSGAALNVNASGKFSPEFAMAWIGE